MVVRSNLAEFETAENPPQLSRLLFHYIFSRASALYCLFTMSDREGHSGAPTDDDLSLPKATVTKMISGASTHFLARLILTRLSAAELLPNDVVCAKETRDLVIECCVGKMLCLLTPNESPLPSVPQNSYT